MKKSIFLYLIASVFMATSCNEIVREPFNNDVAPAQVRNINVESLPGGARITYTLPNDENLLYVKVVYSLADGTVRETKSSFYKNEIVLGGFFDTIQYSANIYSVSRGEKISQPIQVSFKPMTSPIKIAFESISMKKTFGGVAFVYNNPYQADLRFTLLTKDTITGEIVQASNFYSKSKTGRFALRGYNPRERWFGVYISDRWNNKTDTLSGLFTPIFEQKLDKTKFKEVTTLLGDTKISHIGTTMNNLWDDVTGRNPSDIIHTSPGSGLPQWFTFDMGADQSTVISRIKVHHRYGDAYDASYTGGDPKVYEIWGTNNPDADGGWTNWTLLNTCYSVKPSGSPDGIVTAEDVQFAGVDGEEFEFPEGIPPVRYIRFKTIKVWGMLDHIYLAEMTIYGNIVKP